MTGRRLFNKIVRDWRKTSDNDRVSERKGRAKNSITLAGPLFLIISVCTSKFARRKHHLPNFSIICQKRSSNLDREIKHDVFVWLG